MGLTERGIPKMRTPQEVADDINSRYITADGPASDLRTAGREVRPAGWTWERAYLRELLPWI